MRITRDVITDLLPAYLSGEASQDTQELIQAFLAEDPEFAQLVRIQNEPLRNTQIDLPQETEMKILKRTRYLLRSRTLYLAFAIVFTLWPFAFTFDSAGAHWLWAEMPILPIVLGIIAIGLWVKFALAARDLGASDL